MRTKTQLYCSIVTIFSLLIIPLSAHAATTSPLDREWQASGVNGSDIRQTADDPLDESFLVMLPLVASRSVFPNSARSAHISPFIGRWQAVDVDGSNIRLVIAGPPNGPFRITITESYISYCGDEAGIIRGTGKLAEGDPYLLEAELRLVCFTTGATKDFTMSWRYDGGTDTISSGFITWHRLNAVAKACVPPPSGLIGWWPGDGDANELVAGRNGIFRGDAATGSGLVNLAFRLDGDGDFVEVPHDPALNLGVSDFTVDMWVNFNDISGEQVLVEKWIQGDPSLGWTLTKLDGNFLRLAMESAGGEANLDSEPLPLQPGVWYHFAAVRQGFAVTLYMNGTPIAHTPDLETINLNSVSSIKFGHRGSPEDTPGSVDERGFYLNGRIDEVELFVGTALSAEQIGMLYSAGSAGKCKDALLPSPRLDLRVNYGHDWVESFYEAGHRVWVAVTESDGLTVKAVAELFTEPKDFWGGETGFQTSPEDWIPAPPDILPYDWVYAWMDNGATAQVQIGEIRGMIDLAADSITGTIAAPWFLEQVNVECHPWGAPEPEEMKYDAVQPDGVDPYTCSWAGEWDIQPWQDVGVGYTGSDGHWVANAFFVPYPRIVASAAGDWFWTLDFLPGTLSLAIYESDAPDAQPLWQGSRTVDQGEIVVFDLSVHGVDLLPGHYLVVSDGTTEKGLVLETISMEVFDTENEIMAGTAPAGREVWAAAGLLEHQTGLNVTADPESGAWIADFKTISFDITEEMRPWSYAQLFDEDGDANEASPPPPPPNPRFVVFPEWEFFDGLDWPDGATVSITVEGKPECTLERESWGGFFNGNFPEGCDVAAGDTVTFTDGETLRTHEVRSLVVTALDPDEDTVTGAADAGAVIFVWPHDAWFEPLQATADSLGVWQVDLSDAGYDLAPGAAGRSEIRDEAGNATAVDWFVRPPSRLLAHITDNWFEAQNFPPYAELTFWLYDGLSGSELMSGMMQADGNGTAGIWDRSVDLVPGNYLVVSDGTTTKELILEALTFDLFDPSLGLMQGTAPPPEGRLVWVGIGWENDGWSTEAFTGPDGSWVASYGGPVPENHQWVAAQVFDADGDATEDRPAAVISH